MKKVPGRVDIQDHSGICGRTRLGRRCCPKEAYRPNHCVRGWSRGPGGIGDLETEGGGVWELVADRMQSSDGDLIGRRERMRRSTGEGDG